MQMRMILAMVIGFGSVSVHADDFNGHELHDICALSDDSLTTAYVTGYLAGMIAGEKGAKSDSSFRCIPMDVNGRQLRENVCRYVAQRPELRGLNVRDVTHFAVEAVWPCKK